MIIFRRQEKQKMSAPQDKNFELSKKLSKVLRHSAREHGLKMDASGYVPVSDILKLKGFNGFCADDVLQVVSACKKQRFAIEDRGGDGLFIRANQGHSIIGVINPDELLTKITDPTEYQDVLHGTNLGAWELIKSSGGLHRMKRNHIHFARGLPGADGVISGMRSSCQVVLYIDLSAAMADGIPFYTSQNGVILTPGNALGMLPLKYITRVEHR
jgi:2'-phosphotransferase